jgi:hypothetical protein
MFPVAQVVGRWWLVVRAAALIALRFDDKRQMALLAK